VTLPCAAGTPWKALQWFKATLRRFAERCPVPTMGAVHLFRGNAGGWLAHAHVLIFGASDTWVRSAWVEAGGDAVEYAEPVEDVERCIRYAVKGATALERSIRSAVEGAAEVPSLDGAAWLAALRGVPLVVRLPTRTRARPRDSKRNASGQRRAPAALHAFLDELDAELT
jgi:hypothetical protein